MRDEDLIERQLDAFGKRMDAQQEEYEVARICDICSSEICVGEEYYDFDDEIVCNNCVLDYVNEFKRIADI